jgi:VIT1/CCC1 family predicted Fe2+/Mn2+ transporter
MTGRDPNVTFVSLRDERTSAYLYRAMAGREEGQAARLFERLERASAQQAALWEKRLAAEGIQAPPFRPRMRERLVAWLIRRLGPRRLLSILPAMKVRGLSFYREGDLKAGTAEAAVTRPGHADESWHRATQGGGPLRAAVFGANDGLLSNASLILGVAGANPAPEMVVLAGVAGLLAGGFSMAAGEYISVRTQREMLEHQIALEKEELRFMPEEEIEELALIYQARGLELEQARDLATRMVSDPAHGLRTLAREELGLDPDSLASPTAAAAASFASFVSGALLPLLPYLVTTGGAALAGTLAITLLSLLALGAAMSLFTGRPAVYSALRMAGIGAAAGALTFSIGRLFGITLG